MPKYKVGDVLINKKKPDYDHSIGYKERKILAVIDELVAIYTNNQIKWYNEKMLKEEGYTLAQPARWVPEIGGEYIFLNDDGEEIKTDWLRHKCDLFRLSIGNIFRVGDYAGIEALKRKWQEGNV